jgi:hypothetical protein
MSPFEDSLNPCNQLSGAEGFNHVVIRADLQQRDLIVNFADGAHHDDGGLRLLGFPGPATT